MSAFEDIVIVDLDVNRTAWSRVHSSMRTLHLKLNRDPEPGWSRLFFEERNSRVELKRHGLWIEDGYIVFDCLLIDVDDYHLPDIRQSIDYANARSRVLVEASHVEAERQRDEAKHEQQMLNSLRSAIRSDARVAIPLAPAAIALHPAPAPVAVPVDAPAVAVDAEIDADMPLPEDLAAPEQNTVHEERAVVLEERRNDWRARFRAAFERNRK
jgi:hypothetical protein